jgi:hypothetical protein
MTALQSHIKLDEINLYEIIDYTKVPLALVKRLKWDTHARQLTMDMPMLVHHTWSH